MQQDLASESQKLESMNVQNSKIQEEVMRLRAELNGNIQRTKSLQTLVCIAIVLLLSVSAIWTKIYESSSLHFISSGISEAKKDGCGDERVSESHQSARK